MGIKILINGEAGAGKTSLLSSLGEETFVVSRDAKEFALPLPHMMVDSYVDMQTLIHGADMIEDGVTVHQDGIVDKLRKYKEHFGKLPERVAIDSVSQIFMDVIEKASMTPNVYGSQGAEVTKEMGILTKFLHEDLELNGISIILLNHVIPEMHEGSPTGAFIQFGSGKFLAKGGFYSTTNEAITLVVENGNRSVYTRGIEKQARTSNNLIPDKMPVENSLDPKKSRKLKEGESYFNLKEHIMALEAAQTSVKKWAL